MTSTQKTIAIILGCTAALSGGLWFLPRGSVQQKAAASDSAKSGREMAGRGAEEEHEEADSSALGSHLEPLSAEDEASISGLRKELAAGKKDRQLHLADSLARRFNRTGRFDSALRYREVAVGIEPSEKNLFAAGEAAYSAYSVSQSPKKQASLAAKAQERFTAVLARNPKRLDAKTHLALTYVSGPNPMQGIGLLREVLAADPDNQEALYQLGILSMQSTQYDKAAGRFEQILAKHPDNTQARFYLGLAYKELGKVDKARQELERVRETDPDPAVQATVRDYLAELKSN